ncbi:MAG: hypothetical protein K2X11_11115 [Acetobacteraceae bacterium]|nr:hypothetical protein [Acetobacteraceae bacterium]
MKRLLLAAAPLAFLWAAALASPAAAQRSGVYDVTGTALDGTEYTGTLTLQQVGIASFRILWSIGADTIEGVGVVSGLTFSTAFQIGDQAGMAIYEIRPGGVLEGTWTAIGAFTTGRETARPR